MKPIRHILLVSFLVSVSVQNVFAADTSTASEDVQSLVGKIAAAYGGTEVIDGMTSVYAVGVIEASMRQDRGTYEISFKRTRKLRVDTKYQRSSETRILNGNRGYRETDEVPLSQVKDYRFLAMVYQYKHFDLPYGLLNGAYSMSSLETADFNGKSVKIIHLTDAEGPPMDVYIDVETFFIVKVTGYFVVADGRTTTLSSEFSDFRKVGNTVFPFKMTSYAGGQRIAETIMKTCRINPTIPDSLFAP